MIYLFVFKIKMESLKLYANHEVETLPLELHVYGELEYFFEEIIDELEEFTNDKEFAHKAFILDSQIFIFVRINYDWDTMYIFNW